MRGISNKKWIHDFLQLFAFSRRENKYFEETISYSSVTRLLIIKVFGIISRRLHSCLYASAWLVDSISYLSSRRQLVDDEVHFVCINIIIPSFLYQKRIEDEESKLISFRSVDNKFIPKRTYLPSDHTLTQSEI